MKVFNTEIFGADADYFMSLSCDDKKKWVLDNTNQTNETLICQFVENVSRGTDECEGCKKAKAKSDVTKTVSAQTKAAPKSKDNTVDSGSGNNEGTGLAD